MKNSGSPSRQYTKEILCSYGYRPRAFATSTRKGNVVAHSAIVSHDHLFYVYSNLPRRRQFVCFLTRYFFTGSYYLLLLINTTPHCGYGATHVWNWHAFIIRLIPGSNPSRAWERGYKHPCYFSFRTLF